MRPYLVTTETAEAAFIRLNPEDATEHEADAAAFMLKLAANKLYAVQGTEPVDAKQAAIIVETAELWIRSAQRSLDRLKARWDEKEAGL